MSENKFGQMIKVRREAVTLQYLADNTDATLSYWSDIERGNRLPSFEVLMKFCKAVDLDEEMIDELVETFMAARCESCKYKKNVDKYFGRE